MTHIEDDVANSRPEFAHYTLLLLLTSEENTYTYTYTYIHTQTHTHTEIERESLLRFKKGSLDRSIKERKASNIARGYLVIFM